MASYYALFAKNFHFGIGRGEGAGFVTIGLKRYKKRYK